MQVTIGETETKMINEYRKRESVRCARRSIIRHHVSIGEEKIDGETPRARQMTSRVNTRVQGENLAVPAEAAEDRLEKWVTGIGADCGVEWRVRSVTALVRGTFRPNFNPHTQRVTGFQFSLPTHPVILAELRYPSIRYSLVARGI